MGDRSERLGGLPVSRLYSIPAPHKYCRLPFLKEALITEDRAPRHCSGEEFDGRRRQFTQLWRDLDSVLHCDAGKQLLPEWDARGSLRFFAEDSALGKSARRFML